MTTAEILRASLELLEDPEHWTQGAPARDQAGRWVEPDDLAACRWCMEGAPFKAAAGEGDGRIGLAVRMFRRALGDASPWWYNDAPGRQHSEVVAVMRRAVELAEAEEQHA